MDYIANNYLSSSEEDPYAGDDSDNDPSYHPQKETMGYHKYLFTEDSNEWSESLDLPDSEELLSQEVGQYAAPNNSNNDKKRNPNIPNRVLTRKRKRQPEKWVRNINKKLCEHGQQYRNVKGETKRKREIKTRKNCSTRCKFKCSIKITDEEREKIFNDFWSLSDNCKLHFYNKNTERVYKKRSTVKENEQSRRKYSFTYYFHVQEERVRVCKHFFLDTLDISQRRINYFHENKREEVTGIPKQILKGKHPKKVIKPEQKQAVRNHIQSLPRVESHYCRMRTNKEYLECNLNLTKLYELYKEMCTENKLEPVKLSYYRYVFNYEYNIEFLKPKSDRCDVCEEIRISEKTGQEITDEVSKKFRDHKNSKEMTKKNRDADRKNADNTTAIICFDLENVFPLPRSNISCFFYSKKLNTYNLTAHLNLNKQAYCAIWSEGLHGRKAIDISSALIKILTKITQEHQEVTKLIIWSDSCVPQNKNSIMALALKKFMEQNPQIKEIIQKFSEPGHGCVQEVDNIHSQIEKSISGQEIFSPLGLVRALLRVNRKTPFKVFHMRISDFKEYQKATENLNFKTVPFASVKQIRYLRDEPWSMYYKLTHSDDTTFTKVSIAARVKGTRHLKSAARTEKSPLSLLPTVKECIETSSCLLQEDKVFQLYKLFKFMPPVDTEFIKTLFYEYKQEKNIKKLKKKFKGTDIDLQTEDNVGYTAGGNKTKIKKTSKPRPSTSRV